MKYLIIYPRLGLLITFILTACSNPVQTDTKYTEPDTIYQCDTLYDTVGIYDNAPEPTYPDPDKKEYTIVRDRFANNVYYECYIYEWECYGGKYRWEIFSRTDSLGGWNHNDMYKDCD